MTAKESGSIANCLGDKKAIILQNHGLLTVGTTIDSVRPLPSLSESEISSKNRKPTKLRHTQAVAWFIMLEKQCEVQLLADAAAARSGNKIVPIDEPQAASVLLSSSFHSARRLTVSAHRYTYREVGSEAAGYFQASVRFSSSFHLPPSLRNRLLILCMNSLISKSSRRNKDMNTSNKFPSSKIQIVQYFLSSVTKSLQYPYLSISREE